MAKGIELITAAATGLVEMAEMVLAEGVDIHTDNDMPLRTAALMGNADMVRFLVDKGANVQASGNEALLYAAKRQDEATVAFLLSKGANIDDTLLIAGQVEDEVREAYADTLSRPDVQLLGYVRDIAEVYAAADVFVFPTHEEGGPQVIYEAAGCGLASIVSPMGAGRIVRDGIECLLIDPLSVDDLAAKITRLATDEGLRRSMGAAAAKRARSFTWAHAATSLYRQFRAIAAR